jgi:hypothetical protein
MLAHAWLEQRNRKVVELASGERAIVAVPEDYEAAYDIFKVTCERSVVNLSDTHRAILDAVYELSCQSLFDGFSLRKIADKAGVHHSTVAEHKTYLTKSAKLLKEVEGGLDLVSDAEPSWWRKDDLLVGFPRPEQVYRWWQERGFSSPESTRQDRQPTEEDHNPDNYAENAVGHPTRQPPSVTRQSLQAREDEEVSGTLSAASEAETDTENSVGKAKLDREERLSGVSGAFENRQRPCNLDPVSFDLKPEESATVAELKRRREMPKCLHGFADGNGCYLCDPQHPYRLKSGT